MDRTFFEVRYGLESIDPIALKKNFYITYKACIEFFSNLNDITTHEAIKQFEDHLPDTIKHLDHICSFSRCFVNPIGLKHKFENNSILLTAFDTNIKYLHNLDCCDHDFESFDFCCKYCQYIKDGKLLKYGISNKMPHLYSQHYPLQLDGLTTVEEVMIVGVYHVVTILKLRPNGKFNPGSYWRIQRYSMLLSQNLGPLFTLLPLEITSINNILQIVWANRSTP